MCRYEIGSSGNEYWASYCYKNTYKEALAEYTKEVELAKQNLEYGPFLIYIMRVDKPTKRRFIRKEVIK